jgi:hypothetical protein
VTFALNTATWMSWAIFERALVHLAVDTQQRRLQADGLRQRETDVLDLPLRRFDRDVTVVAGSLGAGLFTGLVEGGSDEFGRVIQASCAQLLGFLSHALAREKIGAAAATVEQRLLDGGWQAGTAGDHRLEVRLRSGQQRGVVGDLLPVECSVRQLDVESRALDVELGNLDVRRLGEVEVVQRRRDGHRVGRHIRQDDIVEHRLDVRRQCRQGGARRRRRVERQPAEVRLGWRRADVLEHHRLWLR